MPDLTSFRRRVAAPHWVFPVAVFALLVIGPSCGRPPPAKSEDPEIDISDRDRDQQYGPFRVYHLSAGGGDLELRISRGELKVSDEALRNWVQTAGNAISGYFGKFPLRKV